MTELDEQGDDRIQHDPLSGQQFSHVQNELFRRNAYALPVLLLQRRDGQLSFGGGSHQASDIRVVHLH